MPILVALSLAGGLIAFADGWRLPLLALLVQYILTGILLSQVVSYELALVRVVVGGFVCAILLITKGRWSLWSSLIRGLAAALVRPPRRHGSNDARAGVATEGLAEDVSSPVSDAASVLRSLERRLRDLFLPALLLVTLALASITLTALWQQRSLPPMPGATGLVAIWIMGVGLLTLASRRRPFHIGLGLLTLVTGFEVAYTSLEPSLAMTGLLGGLNIVISLAVASIEAARPPLESGR